MNKVLNVRGRSAHSKANSPPFFCRWPLCKSNLVRLLRRIARKGYASVAQLVRARKAG